MSNKTQPNPKPEKTSERKVQIFDEYSIPFTAQAITLNEEFLKGVLGYLYPVAKDENLTTSAETTASIARIMAGTISNEQGGYLIFGICMLAENTTTKSRYDHCPYIFLCNDSKLSFWRTEVPNLGFTINELEPLGISSVIRYSTDYFNILGCLGFTASNIVRIPYKSGLLEGKYESIIAGQNKVTYSVSSNSINKTYYYSTGERSAQPVSIQRTVPVHQKNLRRKK